MRILFTLLGIVLMSSSAWALEPVGKFHLTTSFNVEGGHFESWEMEDYLQATEKGPIEMRLVLTAANAHSKWGSNIAFFFGPEAETGGDRVEADNGGAETVAENVKDFRLRFSWNRSKSAFYPHLNVRTGDEEKKLARMDMPVGLNRPVTLTISRHPEGWRLLSINGTNAPVQLHPDFDQLTILVSGVEGTISVPSF